MKATFFADGNETIGYGHLTRTGALAAECLSRGHKVEYVTTTPTVTGSVVPAEVTVTPTEDWASAVSMLRSLDPDVLVTDSYEIDHELQRQFSTVVSRLIVISDHNTTPVCCDVLINGNLYASDLRYEWTGLEPLWCCGPEYVLLRQAIREYVDKEVPKRETVRRLLITMGGSDVAELTPTLVSALDGLDLQVDAIVGPGCSNEQERTVRAAAEGVSMRVSVVRDPDDLASRMFQADVGVTTASTTTYELLALGTPLVSIPVAGHQDAIADALRSRDLGFVLGRRPDTDDVRRVVDRYVKDTKMRLERLERGRELVDGRGVKRAYAELQ